LRSFSNHLDVSQAPKCYTPEHYSRLNEHCADAPLIVMLRDLERTA
jgi:hypothetical protein